MLIYIVEDDASICYILKEFIESEFPNLYCQCFSSNQEVLDALEKRHPNLVILDLLLKDGYAYPTLSKIRQSNIPIIVASAVYKFENKIEPFGLIAYLKKPFNLEDLTSLIKNYIPS